MRKSLYLLGLLLLGSPNLPAAKTFCLRMPTGVQLEYRDQGERFILHTKHVMHGYWQAPGMLLSRFYRSLILSLPNKKVQIGETWQLHYTFEYLRDCAPVTVQGEAKLVERTRTQQLKIQGHFSLVHQASSMAGEWQYRVTNCRLTYTAFYCLRRQTIVAACYHFRLKYKQHQQRRFCSRQGRLQFIRQRPESIVKIGHVSHIQVQRAITRGCNYLLQVQYRNGSWRAYHNYRYGPTALALLALLAAECKPQHSAIRKGFAYLRKQTITKTYEVGLTLMALQALCRSQAKHKSYSGHNRSGTCRAPVSLQRWMTRLVHLLKQAHHYDGWDYGPQASSTENGLRYDHSNTQYAVFGLRAAELCGIPAGTVLWRNVLEHFLASQKHPPSRVTITGAAPPAGWGYTAQANVTMSMTAAGLACLLVACDRLQASKQLKAAERKRVQQAVQGALAWMGAHFAQEVKEPHGYILYGIERVGVLTQVQHLGKHDWYQEGATLLLAARQYNGLFWGPYTGEVNTAFAILFLKRATIPVQFTTE